MTPLESALKWVKRHPWWVAFVFVVIAGYTVGKDQALRDNARDAYMKSGRA